MGVISDFERVRMDDITRGLHLLHQWLYACLLGILQMHTDEELINAIFEFKETKSKSKLASSSL